MSTEQRLKYNQSRARKKQHGENRAALKKEALGSRASLRLPITTLFILSWLTASCSGKKDVNISLSSNYITEAGDLTVSGLPQELVSQLSPDCTVITLTGGADLLNQVPIVSDDFHIVSVDPKMGQEGTVSGDAQFGTKGLFGCKSESFPFSIQVDTKPTNCAPMAFGSNNITLMCDGEGQVLDKNTNEVLATIASPATVAIDPNVRSRNVVVQDPAGNEVEMEVSLPTDCQQVPGLVRFNDETGSVQIQLFCNGSGSATVGGKSTNVMTGENWVDLPGGQPAAGNVNFKNTNTTFSILLPPQGAPSLQIGNVRNEGGRMVADVSCQTSLGDTCSITLDGEATNASGKNVPTSVSADADIGEAHDVTLSACDTLGNCVTTNVPAPAYKPFDGALGTAVVNAKAKNVRVSVVHNDPGRNISNVSVSLSQHDPAEGRGFNRIFKKGEEIVVQGSCVSVPGASNGNVTIFDCNLPFRSGPVTLSYNITEAGGAQSGNILIPADIRQTSIIEKGLIESGPIGAGVITALALLYGIDRSIKGYKEASRERTRQDILEFMNKYQFPDDVKERTRYYDYYRSKLNLFGTKRNAYEKLLKQKLRLREIWLAFSNPANVGFNSRLLATFIDTYASDKGSESLLKTTLANLAMEREAVLQNLLVSLDAHIGGAVKKVGENFHIRKDVLEDPEFIGLMKKILGLKDKDWFWEEAGKTMPTIDQDQRQGKRKKYPHISKESIRYLLVAYEKLPHKGDRWTELFTLFKYAGVRMSHQEAELIQKGMVLI